MERWVFMSWGVSKMARYACSFAILFGIAITMLMLAIAGNPDSVRNHPLVFEPHGCIIDCRR